jgi:hypothetical protein
MQSSQDDSPLGGPLELPESSPPMPPQKPPKKPKKVGKIVLIIVIALIIVGALAFAGWKLTRPKTTLQQNAQDTTTETAQNSKTDLPTAGGTKKYTNDIMRLSLAYPDNWTVTEDKNAVTIVSPEFSYTTVDKGSITGIFKIYIRQGAQTADSKYIGKGIAIMPSEKLVYSDPSATQRKDTNLSFFGLDTPDNFNFFLIAGNFNLKKGDTLGPNYGKEADTFIIGGGYSGKDLKDGLAMNSVSADQFQQSAAYKQAIDILKSIQIQ